MAKPTTPDSQTTAAAEATPGRRAVKKERTRSFLIEAASDVFAERGFHAASLMEIASRAGLTTGAVYSNFRSKEDLFLAVIQESAVPLDLELEASTPWERMGHAATQAARDVDLPASRRLFKLQLEFALTALGDPALTDEFVDDLRHDRDELAEFLTSDGPAPLPDFRPSPEQLASAVLAALQGMLQHRFIDRDSVPEELVGWTVQALLHAATAEQGQTDRS